MSEFSRPADACPDSDDVYHHVGCAEVIAEIWTLLDGECTFEIHQKLHFHLKACPGCLKHYGVEERIKALIATKCQGEKAPEGLRERLRLEISRTTIIGGGPA